LYFNCCNRAAQETSKNHSHNIDWTLLGSFRICEYESRTFFSQEFTLQNWGAAYARNIMPFWRLSPRHRYCMLWNSR
jgi:hypothetical protein